tara:strand:- start:25 stop:291 length:267 start_codon:yes stop_codon:yes gene_type:complete
MIVIYEQIYDIINILDVIEDDKFNDYVETYKNNLLKEERYGDILEEKDDGDMYNIKVVYTYPDNPVEWVGFDYVKFDKINNYKEDERE